MLWVKGGDGVNFIRMQGQQLQRWPDFMYPSGVRYLFTRVIPTLAAMSFPARFVVDRREWPGVVYVFGAAIVMWFVVGVIWRAGLRQYESASS
jgi:ABC-2 type transport system permease protein